jgi:hypothetical protein
MTFLLSKKPPGGGAISCGKRKANACDEMDQVAASLSASH